MAFQLISAREAESLMNHWEYVVIDLRNDRDYRKGHMELSIFPMNFWIII